MADIILVKGTLETSIYPETTLGRRWMLVNFVGKKYSIQNEFVEDFVLELQKDDLFVEVI